MTSRAGHIAVIGMACRVPKADSLDAFWRVLNAGVDTTTDAPGDRWDSVRSEVDVPALRGGFLDHVDRFDAAFFGISPAEAAAMDPQQRLMLELSWEALEDAGIVPSSLAGTKAGVFAGSMNNDYAVMTHLAGVTAIRQHTMAGRQSGVIANRVSYVLGLRGPSLTVDTGQSSSLAAVHLACESLRSGESDVALAGGVNLALLVAGTVAAARFGGLSESGRCHTFDSAADGFVRGEGGGVVLLKPLAQAQADGDRIYCVIRGSAMNNNGGGAGLTSPDRDAQQDLVRSALEHADVSPGEVQYVELHGTGTRLGDQVEAAALGAVFGSARAPEQPLLVGSVKTNLGHLEGAAGIVGLIKTALAIAHRRVPASLNFRTPPPEIPLGELGLRVRTESGPWPGDRLLAGVSAFGMGGTNVHVVVEQGPGQASVQGDVKRALAGPAVWPLSARTESGLRGQARRLAAFLGERADLDPADVSFSLATTRSSFEYRAAVVGADRNELLSGLGSLADGAPGRGVVRAAVTSESARVAFLFAGQGSQRLGMGSELASANPVFAEALEEVCAELDRHTALPVKRVMWAEPGSVEADLLDNTEYTQPALFAIEVALFRLLERLGVRPAMMTGHSVGELAAAHVAGVLSLPDAALLVCARGRLMQRLPGGGAMVAVRAGEDEVRALLAETGSAAEIAAVNGPASVVVSGSREAVTAAAEALSARGRKTRLLRVSHAFHSAALEPMLGDYEAVASGVRLLAPSIGLVSALTGELVSEELQDPAYWVRQARDTVRFGAAVETLSAAGATLFVELGPDAALTAMARECVPAREVSAFLPLLRADRPEATTLVTAVAALHIAGVGPDWRALLGQTEFRRVPLPTYAFERRRYWFDDDLTATPSPSGDAGGVSLDPSDVVRTHVAAVLGFGNPDDVEMNRPFRDLGFDSLSLVELVDQLKAATGAALVSGVAFDHPTPAALAAYLRAAPASATESPVPAGLAPSAGPIAIVGMGCRLPGGVSSPGELWDLLAEGRDVVSAFPADRGWDLEALYSLGPGTPGTTNTRQGGFLHEAAWFDHEFFGISPREAVAMDPQQRLLLETAWEAVERAGIDASRLRGSDTGVFVGVTAQEYGTRLADAADSDADGYALTGTTASVASGRLSYVLGLEGPALTVDTACSSSLVAIHQAVRSLRSGECALALAGGAAVLSSPGMFVEFARQGGLAADGRCKAFAEAADGTGWAEGVGVLVLERLDDAVRNGRRVLGVIRGSAVNSDGASNGLTAPNGLAQRRVITRALADAGLDPDQVDVVEAHGTGTTLGDPIEARAVLATYGRREEHPLLLGSLKSNIGHAQAAAGVLGVIKMVLALRHEVVPKTLHVDAPSSHVDWSAGAVELVTEARPWPAVNRPWRAGVSSFGISGTNAHLIVEQAPPVRKSVLSADPAGSPALVPWVVSARSDAALDGQLERLRSFAEANPGTSPVDIGSSLVSSRSQFAHRTVLLVGERGIHEEVRGKFVAAGKAVFVFPGQGSQWVGMGRELLVSSPEFASRIEECAHALEPWVDWSLLDVLSGAEDAPPLDRVDVVQPVLWAVMVALAEVWRSRGVRPAAVAGHSQGEIAAACVAGALTVQDAARVVALRSLAVAEVLPGGGGMASVPLGEAEVRVRLAPWEGRLDVAAFNSPVSTVVAGEVTALEEFLADCVAAGIRARRVPVDYASHSPQVEALRERLLADLAGIEPHAGDIPLYSTVTGTRLDTTTMDAGYWYRNLRQPVLFDQVTRALAADGHRVFVEPSAHPVLTVPVEQTLEDLGISGVVAGSLRRDRGGADQMMSSLAQAYVCGASVEWGTFFPASARRDVELPTYAFHRRRFWLESGTARAGSTPRGPVESAGPTSAAGGDGATALTRRLAGLSGAERDRAVLAMVRAEAAGIVRAESAERIPADSTFRDIGFDSVTALELRNRVRAATGLQLANTLAFDYPTPRELSRFLLDELTGRAQGVASPAAVLDGSATEDPIVIVGMACRYPGGVDSPDQLWQLVTEGRTASSEFPVDRGWDLEALRGRGGLPSRGGFLDAPGAFDAAFFGISPREAVAMDPQQRLMLEVSWEALERAEIDPLSLKGSRTGVFVGVSGQDYGTLLAGSAERKEGYALTGGACSVVSGRVAYTLGLEGPAVTVDTACSASLVALHLAAQAVRAGECDLALAGGVTVMSTPMAFEDFAALGGLAQNGSCKAFAEAADGTGWAEGAGLLVVERLSEAERRGHRVLAVVRGSAVNSDGASNGLTAPNGPSQQRVIRQALAGAGLSAEEVDAVEAHGTGTTLGDPIEAHALLAAYGQERERPLLLGSVKSNLGHTQAAAGVAGVIKMVLALRHGVLPQTLHVDAPTSVVDWSAGSVELLTEARPWPEVDRRWRAGVSSFGISGTNAHVILEQAPPAVPRGEEVPAPVSGVVPWVVSARSETALEAQLARVRSFADAHPDVPRADVGYSLASSRAELEHRAVLLATTGGVVEAAKGAATERVTAVLFSGQGAQRLGMGRGLAERFPVFAQAWDAVLAELDRHTERPLREVVWGTESTLVNRTGWAQLGVFAVEVALFRLVESWGVRPDYLSGHSIGEVAAAHVAGVLSLTDACALVAARARLMQALPEGGAMVAVRATEDEVVPWLTGAVSIAAVNGPDSVVLSGPESEVERVTAEFVGLGRKTTRLRVSHAFHSALMEPMLAEFQAVVEGLTFAPPGIPIVSTVTGSLAGADSLCSPAYWVQQVREPVRFADGLAALLEAGVTAFVELGPDGTLSALAAESLPDDVPAVPLLRKDRDEETSAMSALAQLSVAGVSVDWPKWFAGSGALRVELPTYAFEHQRYWPVPARGAGDVASAGLVSPGHPLLGAGVELAGGQGWLFTARLSLATSPWLADHAVHGVVLLPGTALVEWAIRAGDEAGCGELPELTLEAPLTLSGHDAVVVQVVLGTEDTDGRRSVDVYSRPEQTAGGGEWTRHASGVLAPEPTGVEQDWDALRVWPPAGAEPVDLNGFYDMMLDAGYTYGPVFRGLRAAWRAGSDVFAEIALPVEQHGAAEGFGVHPALLDVALHPMRLGVLTADDDRTRLPFVFTGVSLRASGATAARVRLSPAGPDAIRVAVADPAGTPVASIDELTLRPVEPGRLAAAGRGDDAALFDLDWATAPATSGEARPGGRWVVLGPDPREVTEGLRRAGVPVESAIGLESVPAGTDVVVLCAAAASAAGDPAAVRDRVIRLWTVLRAWLADTDRSEARLVVLTRGAVAAAGGDVVTDLAGAGEWGLARSAQTEHPGRVVLADVDGSDSSIAALSRVLAEGHVQVAIRDGRILRPRLVRVPIPVSPAVPARPEFAGIGGTVLITGGTGTLGGMLARHLVTAWGVRRLVLTGRRGLAAPGAPRLQAELSALGAQVEVTACDLTQRHALEQLLREIPPEHPLTGVVHAAGVVEDGVLESLTPERIEAVLRPKIDAALWLHELTAGRDLSLFAVFSSVAGLLGTAGQANYAAANTVLDGLMQQRRAQGLAGVSLAWGWWARTSAMTGDLGQADLARLRRSGMAALSDEQGLALFDHAMTGAAPPVVAALRLDPLALRAQAAAGSLPEILAGLAGAPVRATATAGVIVEADTVRQRLAALPEAEQHEHLLAVVRSCAATVLGHDDESAVSPDRAFQELGFDSLTAVEFRNRLNEVTGLRLPVTVTFEHSSPVALAGHLRTRLLPAGASAGSSILDEIDRLGLMMAAGVTDESVTAQERLEASERMRNLLERWNTGPREPELTGGGNTLAGTSDDELIDFIGKELGIS